MHDNKTLVVSFQRHTVNNAWVKQEASRRPPPHPPNTHTSQNTNTHTHTPAIATHIITPAFRKGFVCVCVAVFACSAVCRVFMCGVCVQCICVTCVCGFVCVCAVCACVCVCGVCVCGCVCTGSRCRPSARPLQPPSDPVTSATLSGNNGRRARGCQGWPRTQRRPADL